MAEFIHLTNVLFDIHNEMPGSTSLQELTTIFGTYRFIGDNYGYSILSPAFERPDKELFLSNFKAALGRNRKILYVDVGAFVGDYTVGLLTFVNSKRVTTLAFEPDPVCFSLLQENLRRNNIHGVRVFKYGLSNTGKAVSVKGYVKKENRILPSRVPYTFRTLDSILPKNYYKKFDSIFVKVDIEGHEEEAFDGARYLLTSGKKIYLMIEDCVNPSIINYLKLHGFTFKTKITPYDSFWELNE